MARKHDRFGNCIASEARPDTTKREFDEATGDAAKDGYTLIDRAPAIPDNYFGQRRIMSPEEAERMERMADDDGMAMPGYPYSDEDY